MESYSLISLLIDYLSKIKPSLYLPPPSITQSEEIGSSIQVVDRLDKCEPLDSFAYLDSSSRFLSYLGFRMYMSSVYINDKGEHISIPGLTETSQFIAIKSNVEALKMIESNKELSNIVSVKNILGLYYDEDYKDDNILDEMRISLENYGIKNAKSDTIFVDGPAIPGPYLPIVGEPYRQVFEILIKDRSPYFNRIVGVVKRLDISYKLSRIESIKKALGGKRLPDNHVMTLMFPDNEIHITDILSEDWAGYKRYMVYVKYRDYVYRVESTNKDLLCKGVATAIARAGVRGIPDFIEIADRMARKLSASTYIIGYLFGKEKLGVTYDETNKFNEVLKEFEYSI